MLMLTFACLSVQMNQFVFSGGVLHQHRSSVDARSMLLSIVIRHADMLRSCVHAAILE